MGRVSGKICSLMLKRKIDHNHWLHLWKFDSSDTSIDLDLALLNFSEEEISRAKNFIHDPDRERYVKAHYFLRKVLSKYLKINARDIKFSRGINGKPFINNTLFFNLSYRDTFFLLGISNCSKMGVDIEKIKSIEDIPLFCENYFALKEREIITAENNKLNQLSLLFTLWTMKESVIKALGSGFLHPLTNYDLNSFLYQNASAPNFDPENSWTIQMINVKQGFKAAFAIQTSQVNIDIFEYEDY